MAEVAYDDKKLRAMFEALSPKERVRAFKGAFRKEANIVRKAAVGNLRTSLNSNRDLERGIRALVFKRKAGFRVTVGTKGDRGFHVNRRGQKKPVLIWAEEGTAERHTKSQTRSYTRSRKGHSTGRMKRYAFMAKTLSDVGRSVTDDLHNQIVDSVRKIAEKYGCK